MADFEEENLIEEADALDEEDGVIELEDEDGNISRFYFVDSVEYNGVTYYALVPEDAIADDEGDGADQFVVLKEQEVDGNMMLMTIDDDNEYNEIGEVFLQRFAELPGYED
ncbi:MAG: DUF1292 domain-containing protein [Oscillospiraceae bacterium]